ncbi:MAG TPA: glycosyltransferase [Candidatus Omnitrophota bacterium]|nr:glycosyltransferase [Candidatus Omnitrophota bacterium]
MTVRGLKEWAKVAEVFLWLILGATTVFYVISIKWPLFLDISYYFIVTLLVVDSAFSYWFTTSVFNDKKFVPLPTAENKPVPRTTFIVSAYLPNEVAVIECTLLNILQKVKRPADGIEVILAYNTPHMEELELKLRELTYRWPELILANAYGSRSKSENLNYAIDLASGRMIALLDADHLVSEDCLALAWRWLDEGYDVAQGRCKVRNCEESILAKLVEIEFEIIYGVNHLSRSIIFDTALFGGSNGYWKVEVLKKVKFLENMLTEDIDTTLRGVLEGYRFVHDRSIVSSELAPTTIPSFWFQRKRWSQGWFECSMKYQIAIWRNRYLNFQQKFIWTMLLTWRIFFDVVSMLLFPVVFAFWLHLGRIAFPVNAYILFALVFILFSGPYQALIAYKNAAPPKAPVWEYLFYSFFVWPYTVFKTVIHIIAIRDQLAGEHSWIVSKRTAAKI